MGRGDQLSVDIEKTGMSRMTTKFLGNWADRETFPGLEAQGEGQVWEGSESSWDAGPSKER